MHVGLIGVLPKYFNSEWSVAKFRGLREDVVYLVAFGSEKNTVIIIGMDGRYVVPPKLVYRILI